jgi:hypothetical protein
MLRAKARQSDEILEQCAVLCPKNKKSLNSLTADSIFAGLLVAPPEPGQVCILAKMTENWMISSLWFMEAILALCQPYFRRYSEWERQAVPPAVPRTLQKTVQRAVPRAAPLRRQLSLQAARLLARKSGGERVAQV